MNIHIAKSSGRNYTYFLCYVLASFILFLPVVNKSFVSDDFVVLKRICLEKTIWTEGFFRPLSDCSIYLNYLLGGLDPLGFNLVNIFIHAVNSFLLLQFCLKWRWVGDNDLQRRFAIMASILFLTYPFHNESIVWLLGRGSSLAGTFCLAALLIFLSDWNGKSRLIAISICYFIGLMAYETIVILPLLILILLSEQRASKRAYVIWIAAFLCTGTINFLLRYHFSGALLGAYGEKIIDISVRNFAGSIVKVFARLIIPPIKDSTLFIITTITAATTVFILFRTSNKVKALFGNAMFGKKLLTFIGCTVTVAAIVGVSTRTSEGDRLLYIPSFFVCCLLSYFICRYILSRSARQVIFVLLCSYNIMFLELNNYNWRKAGEAVNAILTVLKSDTGEGNIYIANLPNEKNGAYIFREGFKDALIIHKIDTAKIIVINKLSKELSTNTNTTWRPVYSDSKIFIPPFLELTENDQDESILMKFENKSFSLPAGGRLYYWNQNNLVLWDKPEKSFK